MRACAPLLRTLVSNVIRFSRGIRKRSARPTGLVAVGSFSGVDFVTIGVDLMPLRMKALRRQGA